MNNAQEINQQLRDFPGNKYYRLHIESTSHDLSITSKLLHSITGYYADEYIVPATTIQNIFNVISDESAFKGHNGVSAVVLPIVDKNQNAAKDSDNLETELEQLCKDYAIDKIHFTDILGHNSLGERRRDFLKSYVAIVSKKELWAVSFSINQSEFSHQLALPNISERELYFILFWNIMENIAEMLPNRSIFHVYFEQDNNLSTNLVNEYIHKIYDGLKQCKTLEEKQDSICKHPLFFSKKALFYSSLADLAAYSNNVIQQKLDSGIPIAKIKKNHGELIEITRKVFKHYTSFHQSKIGAASLILGDL